MPRVRDVLHRFRPSGTPGAATAAGVPVDRAGELAAELEPVLALLAETERECAEILERARRDAAATRARDAERVRGVLASGRARVEAERAAAAAQSRGLGAGRPGADGPDAGGGRGVGHGGLDDTLAPYVDLVLDGVRSLLGEATRGETTRGDSPHGDGPRGDGTRNGAR